MSGKVWKPVTCQNCGCKFAYQLKRQAEGQTTDILWLNGKDKSQDIARKRSEANLERNLQQSFDVIDCPDCGHYQDNMMEQIRRDRLGEAALMCFAILVLIWAMYAIFAPKNESLTIANALPFFVLAIVGASYYVWKAPRKASGKTYPRKFDDKYPVLRKNEIEELAAYVYHKEGRLIDVPRWD